MVATLPERVTKWISDTLSLDEVNILQLRRHGTHALKGKRDGGHISMKRKSINVIE